MARLIRYMDESPEIDAENGGTGMISQSYYRLTDASGCNSASCEVFLRVNCAGACVLRHPFRTHAPLGRHDYYLMHLLAGRLDMMLDGECLPFVPGDLLILPPERGYEYVKRDEGEMCYLWAHFTGYGVRELLDGCQLATGRILRAGLWQELIDGFQAVFEPFVARDDFSELEAAGRLTAALARAGRRAASQEASVPPPDSRALSASLDHLRLNYAQSTSVTELAEMEHLSASRFAALFKRHTGLSPQRYLLDTRLRNARTMLMQTDLSVKQIAQAVGYEDALYFSRLFRKRFGESPRAFRARGAL